MSKMPLRYNISSWNQAVRCLSNTSRYLHIHHQYLLNVDAVTGEVIQVYHETYGVLFAYLVNGRGPLLDADTTLAGHWMSTDDVLSELHKFGFYISFDQRANLPRSVLQYLATVDGLQFQKIRTIRFKDSETITKTDKSSYAVVAFNVSKCPDWVKFDYSPSYTEFTSATSNGYAINLNESAVGDIDWSWLTYVANIQDILADNGMMISQD